MSDRHRLARRRVNSLTAAARILQPTRLDAPKPLPWHDAAWGFRDTIGELRFAEMWLSNAFSRARLVAARRPEPGKEPEPVDGGPAFDLVERLSGGVGGQANLLRSFGSFLLIPGVGYLVGDPRNRPDRFIVVDSEDLRHGSDTEGGEGYELRDGEATLQQWRPLPPGTVVTKVFRPHPRRRWEADSPTRAALPILRELELLTMHVEATATSRLAGAGMQAFPSEAEFPGGWDTFIENWINAIVKPASDRSLAAALAPFPIKMPGDLIPRFKEGYISYSTAFDEKSIELREEAITRLGNAMDMPRQVLTGEQRNHWGDWQVEESGLKLHVEPGCETICDGLTVGYLYPGLDAAVEVSEGARRDLERIESEQPDGEWLVWYDTSDLRVRPDRSQAIQFAYDAFEADGEALRKELGISEAQPPDMNDPETQQRVWLKLISHETLGPVALEKLGLLPAGQPIVVNPPGPVGPTPVDDLPPAVPDPGPDRALPGTEDRQPDVNEPAGPPAAADAVPDHVPDAWSPLAVVAACDALVHRAFERAGRRVLNKLPREADNRLARDVPAVQLHTAVRLDSYLPAERLFADAWERLPEVAGRLGEDPDVLAAALNGYVSVLVRTQQEHTWDRLADALGVCPCAGASTNGAEP